MRAVQYRNFGSSDVLEEVTLPDPRPGPGQLLVRVHAAAVNPLDWKLRRGKLKWVLRRKLPYVPGCDVAGEVVEGGSADDALQPGDRVFGFVDPRRGGGYAELVALDADKVARAPGNIGAEEAAGLPCAGLTALQALDRVSLHEESRVLVIGAAGGVGHLAAQIARARGARVNGVCGPDNVEWLTQLGLNRVIDYSSEPYLEEATGYDLIFDAAAVQSYRACKPILKRDGTFLTTIPTVDFVAAMVLTRLGFKGQAGFVVCRANRADLERLAEMVGDGRIRPHVRTVLPLSEARQSHELSETGHGRGKIVLQVA